MSIKLNRKGAGLAGEDRVKENQNLEMIEQEFAGLESVKTDSAAAKLSALEALAKADAADSLSKNVQTQLNTIVVEGDSSPQAAQASVGARGEDYGGNLKARLDAEFNETAAQLAETVDDISTLSRNDFKWLGNDKAVVSILFDDGMTSLYENARPLLKAKNFPWNVAVSSEVFLQQNPSNGFMTVEQLRELHQVDGVEVLSHSALHEEFTEAKDVKWSESQLKESKQALKKLGINANGFVAPNINVAAKHIPNIAQNFDYAFYNSVYQTYTPVIKEQAHPMPRMSFASDYALVSGWIDQAIANKDFIVLWAHNVDSTDVSVANFTALLDLLEAKQNQGLLEVKGLKQTFTEHSTMFAKEQSAIDFAKEPVVSKLGANQHFNSRFNSGGKGWIQSKSNASATLSPQAINSKYVVILDNVGIGDWAEISQKVATDFKQNVVANITANILSNSSTTADSADLRVIVRLMNGNTLVREMWKDTKLYPSTAGYEINERFNLPYLSSYKHTHIEVKYRFIKRKAESIRFEIQYPYLEFLSPKSPPKNNHPTLNVSQAGSNMALDTSVAMDTDYFKLIFGGQVIEYDNVSNGAYTVGETGIYEISSVMQIQGGTNTNGYIRLVPVINGVRQPHDTYQFALSNGQRDSLTFRNFLSLQAGDVVELHYTKNIVDLTILLDSDIVLRKIS